VACLVERFLSIVRNPHLKTIVLHTMNSQEETKGKVPEEFFVVTRDEVLLKEVLESTAESLNCCWACGAVFHCVVQKAINEKVPRTWSYIDSELTDRKTDFVSIVLCGSCPA